MYKWKICKLEKYSESNQLELQTGVTCIYILSFSSRAPQAGVGRTPQAGVGRNSPIPQFQAGIGGDSYIE